jgi:hypothetical protein
MRKLLSKRVSVVALSLGIVFGGSYPALAAQYELANYQVVTNYELDTMRGGFVTDGGLQISVGIIKAILVDGLLQTINTLNIPKMTKADGTYVSLPTSINTDPMQIGSQQSDGATLVHNLGNAIVVQNSLNRQVIQNKTVLNATSNSMSMFREVNLVSRINQQMVNMLH